MKKDGWKEGSTPYDIEDPPSSLRRFYLVTVEDGQAIRIDTEGLPAGLHNKESE